MTYIAFEGGEGSGKSTQAELLAKRLGAVATREPGGTALGLAVRQILLSNETSELSPQAEALLMSADRAQHIAHVVKPSLAEGKTVVSDRSVYSSLAYQGEGRGLGMDHVRSLNRWALGDTWPDLVVFIDVPVDVAMARLKRGLDRFEQAGKEFHQRVLAGYHKLASEDANLWLTIDGTGTVDEVGERVWQAVEKQLGL